MLYDITIKKEEKNKKNKNLNSGWFLNVWNNMFLCYRYILTSDIVIEEGVGWMVERSYKILTRTIGKKDEHEFNIYLLLRSL